MTQKILILGATGFIGRNLVELFQNIPGYSVHAVRFTRPEYPVSDGVTWHKADLRDGCSVAQIFEDCRPDIVLQAAATTSGAKDIVSKPYIHVTDNAIMNSYILKSAFDFSVKHFIFFSCTVMYQSSEHAIRETDFDANLMPFPKYFGAAHTKLYIEKLCEFYSRISETKYTVIRHSNIYGNYDKFDLDRSHFFGATITKVMNANETITVWGSGAEKRDLLHVCDLCHFVFLSVERQKNLFEIFNCGLGKSFSVNEVVEKIIEASGKRLSIQHDITQPSIETDVFLNCDHALHELGWKPKITLEEGIYRTISWWKANYQKLN